jgi:nucleoside-diphosphate-sugar epimerase
MNLKKKKIVVTGGAGFIGSHLVKKLVELGAKVTVVDNFSRGTRKNLKEVKNKIIIKNVDLRQENKVKKIFQGQEIIFNLAALNTGVDYDQGRTQIMFEENMLLQMIPLRVAAKIKSIKKFVQVSSASVYSRQAMEHQVPTPETADTTDPEPSKLGYALAKKMGENLARWYSENSGLWTISTRFINV